MKSNLQVYIQDAVFLFFLIILNLSPDPGTFQKSLCILRSLGTNEAKNLANQSFRHAFNFYYFPLTLRIVQICFFFYYLSKNIFKGVLSLNCLVLPLITFALLFHNGIVHQFCCAHDLSPEVFSILLSVHEPSLTTQLWFFHFVFSSARGDRMLW